MLFSEDFTYSLAAIFVAIFATVIAYYKWTFTYWKRRGLAGPPPSVPFGNLKDVLLGKIPFGNFWRNTYFELKSKGHKHGGVYAILKPQYIPVNLDIVKHILQNDFQYFSDHGLFVNEKADPLSANVSNLDGLKWKMIRSKVSPTFTPGKMKMMFPTLVDCTSGLRELLSEARQNGPVDIKDVMDRFTTDMICSCVFGVECNSMKNPNTEFRKQGIKIMERSVRNTIKQFSNFFVPHWILRLVNFRPNDEEVVTFFQKLVEETVRFREENNIIRKDFMHLLIQLKNEGKLEDDEKIASGDNITTGTMTIDEIAAQCYIFFIAGFETSASAMSFASYELAVNPDVQDKLRREINNVLRKHDNKLTYESVMEMTYLDQVICETLRKHPPLHQLFRVCTKDYNVPGTGVVVEKGTSVMVPIWGIHYDPEYYPDPEKFDPDRFTEESKAKRPHFSWLPFGEGPRICLGLRFGMLQSIIGLVILLTNYNLALNKKTKQPLTYNKKGLLASTEGGIWIDLDKI